MKKLLLIIVLLINACTEPEKGIEINYVGGNEYIYFDQIGKEIVEVSNSSLKNELIHAIREGGYENALLYCNENATAIHQQLSQQFGVKIRRISTKNRAYKNRCLKIDSLVLETLNDQALEGIEPAPALIELNAKKYRYYHPIMVESRCLSCHGNVNSNIGKEFYSYIKEFYPRDKAIDYVSGDLRGAWIIDFNRPESNDNQ